MYKTGLSEFFSSVLNILFSIKSIVKHTYIASNQMFWEVHDMTMIRNVLGSSSLPEHLTKNETLTESNTFPLLDTTAPFMFPAEYYFGLVQ